MQDSSIDYLIGDVRLVRDRPFCLLVCPGPGGRHGRSCHHGGEFLAGWRGQIAFC